MLQAQTSLVHTLQPDGLAKGRSRENLKINQVLSFEDTWEILIQTYRGNFLALKLISTTIQELFNGSVSEFIQYQTLVVGKFSVSSRGI